MNLHWERRLPKSRVGRARSLLAALAIAFAAIELLSVAAGGVAAGPPRSVTGSLTNTSAMSGMDSRASVELSAATQSLSVASRVAANGPAPSPRWGSAMAYDSKNGYVVLFGGYNGSSYFNDTWKFSAGVWSKIPSVLQPPARAGASMTYDAKNGYVVLFGGVNRTGALLDTWKFVGGQWTKLTATTQPAARFLASMTYDANDGYVVLFGGVNKTGSLLADTWKFVGGVWTKLVVATHPSARYAAGMTDDSASGYLLLFGGCHSTAEYCGTPLNDTWTFAAGSWKKLAPTLSPSARGGMLLVADPSDGYILMFGGSTDTKALRDSWSFSGGTWSPITTTKSPSARVLPGAAFDAKTSEVVLFGGTGVPLTPLGDTWMFSGGTWTKT